MPVTDPDLWQKIRSWPLPHRAERDEDVKPPRNCTRFEHNLRKLGDWTDEAADKITSAYRRFIYLKAISGETLTPPTWIDKAWHLHMSFKEDYAALLAAIGRDIAHREGLTRAERHAAWDRGRALWRAEFDKAPPDDIWPERPKVWREAAGWFFAGIFVVLFGGLLFFEEPGVPAGFPWNARGTWFEITVVSFILAVVLLYKPAPERMARCG